jgi:hypothetical protein
MYPFGLIPDAVLVPVDVDFAGRMEQRDEHDGGGAGTALPSRSLYTDIWETALKAGGWRPDTSCILEAVAPSSLSWHSVVGFGYGPSSALFVA